MSPTSPGARLEARITLELHGLLKRAAEIEGRSVTDYVTQILTAAAHRTIEQANLIHLSMEDQIRFAEALIDPPPPSPALLKAMERRRDWTGR